MREYMDIGLSRRNAHVKITGVNGSKRAVRDALARLEEQSPDEAAVLREHADTGRSTDPRWSD